MKEYNKLVRDRIPEIIERTEKSCTYHIAGKEDFKNELLKKLCEEAAELSEDPCEDVFEVIEAIIDEFGFSKSTIDQIKMKKKKDRGGFEKRIVLEKVF